MSSGSDTDSVTSDMEDPLFLSDLDSNFGEESAPDPEPENDAEKASGLASSSWLPGPYAGTYDFEAYNLPGKFKLAVTPESTPFEVFRLFLTEDIMQNICAETNAYALLTLATKPNKEKKPWKDVTPSELWAFIGLSLLMGLNRRTSIKDYWSTNLFLYSPIYGKTMARNRYEEIFYHLHFIDKKHVDKTDKLSVFGTFLNSILDKFRESMEPGKHLCVEESRESRFGIRYFVILDCESKFVLDLIPYVERRPQIDENTVKEFGYDPAMILKLVENYTGKGRTIVADNWLNTPCLAEKLLEMKTFVLGVLGKHAKFVPKFENKLEKYEAEVKNQKGIMIEKWKDNKEMYLISTGIAHEMKNVKGKNNVAKTKPISAILYETLMRSVEQMDRGMEPFFNKRKSTKWYKKMALHMVDICAFNSCIAYNSTKEVKIGLKQYLLMLITEILENRQKETAAALTPTLPIPRLEGRHFPKQMPKRSKCTLCGTSSRFRCEICNKCMCIKNNNCFTTYHTLVSLPNKRSKKVCEEELQAPLNSS